MNINIVLVFINFVSIANIEFQLDHDSGQERSDRRSACELGGEMKTVRNIAVAIMAFLALSGAYAKGDSPETISGMVISFSAGEVPVGPIQEAIEKYTGCKLKINFVPSEGYVDKVNIALASGNLPEFMVIVDTKNAAFVQAVKAGAFWDITPYIKDYPRLAGLPDIGWKNSAIGGKNFGLYRARFAVRQGIIWRQDWQRKLHLKNPETADDLDAMLKAFARLDADGNGKGDTIPLVMPYDKDRGIISQVTNLAVWLGGVNGYGVKNGRLVQEMFTDEYLKALDLLRSWYKEKLLWSEFPISDRETTFNKVRSGRAGAYMSATSDLDLVWDQVDALGGRFSITNVMKTPAGETVAVSDPGFSGIIAFPKSTVKSEARLRQILSFFNKFNEDPMADLLHWGFQPKHSSIIDNQLVQDKDQMDAYNREVQPYRQVQIDPAVFDLGRAGKEAPSTAMHRKASDEATRYAILDPTLPLLSSTWSQLQGTLTTLQSDAITRYIMGVYDLAAFKKARDTWLERGGQKVLDEYNKAYAEIYK